MTMPESPDLRPDEQVGHLLRELFPAQGTDAFADRVMQTVRRHPRGRSSWDVLAEWFRPEFVAAAAAAAAIAFWLGLGADGQPPTLAEALQPAEAPAGLVVDGTSLAVQVVAGVDGLEEPW